MAWAMVRIRSGVCREMALITAAEGNAEDTERRIGRLLNAPERDLAARQGYISDACGILAMSGAAKAAVACMRTAMDEPSEFMPFLDPYLAFYDPIREEPAFVELLAELENELASRVWLAGNWEKLGPLAKETGARAVACDAGDAGDVARLFATLEDLEALGSEAVEQVVPLADPGTRESLRIPLEDELDHVRFGVEQLKQALAAMSGPERARFMAAIPERLDAMTRAFHGFGIEVESLFAAVGVDYQRVRRVLAERRTELLRDLAA